MRELSAPISICLVMTDVCNLKCRHCLNFWRQENSRSFTLSNDHLEKIASVCKERGIFHVVISGGEPLARFDLLKHAIKTFKEHKLTFSVNSNLMLATDSMITQLLHLGLDHVLTSLNSDDPRMNDDMVYFTGAHDRIIKGITTAVRNGMRVSANMIVTQRNKDHVYKTGMLAHELGCTKFFGTRVVPSVMLEDACRWQDGLSREETLHTLDEMMRLKKDTGISIGTLVSYPLCMLGDLEKYHDFVGRGCPSQMGNRININPNGDVQACPHSNVNAGNIFRQDFHEIWEAMKPWHDGSLRNPACAGCKYIDVCYTGCRISSSVINKALNAPDPFMVNPKAIYKDYIFESGGGIEEEIRKGCRFTVPKRIRFREEKDFYVLNVRWANTLTLDRHEGEFLKRYWESGESFALADFGADNLRLLNRLFFKNVVESEYLKRIPTKSSDGCSVDPSMLR